ncbi:hypothetical protein HPB47_027200 [Ixodes persulcatus]|uniref:Uncharacterized protein n=1 Tax=Ixodes persulcatus TaxID=34615 RepID=A0AC60PWQ6_IXOPE|nr:hypothetical protein HPB47_027200 [Ixodes persulcatus]
MMVGRLSALLVLVVSCKAQEELKLTLANNRFGLRLFYTLPSAAEVNVFFSPYSVSTAMGMTYAGARRDTGEELFRGLGYSASGLTAAQVLDSYARHTQRLLSSESHSTLKVANGVAIQENLTLLDSFRNTLESSFNAEVHQVDFVQRQQDARQFWNGGVSPTLVDTMTQKMRVGYGSFDDLDVDVAELPYRGHDYSMVILLPKRNDGVDRLKGNLTVEIMRSLLSELRERDVDVFLPKFKLESTYQLEDSLTALGIRQIFSNGADLSGISDRNLRVSAVVHKAVLEVSEEGSEASSGTGVVILPGSAVPVAFVADHPFLLFIRNTRTNDIIFAGQVNKL